MASSEISPLAPKAIAVMPPVAGVRLATAAPAMKYQDRDDIFLGLLAPGTTVAGVFTQSKTASPPVDWCRKALGNGRARCVLVNAGNANAFTGSLGVRAVEEIAAALGQLVDAGPQEIYQASTGVIGETLPHEMIVEILAETVARAGEADWSQAAHAIMTTDTYPKMSSRTAVIDGIDVVINGIAKGSGMIAPDMATLLGFIFTDAPVASDILQNLLASAVDKSFNAITVDSDTSTSDMVLAFATGQAKGASVIKPFDAALDERLRSFREALEGVCLDLAHQVVRDGEGAQKFISISIQGAESDKAARVIGLSIANSPLVKTAIAGEDANWGRIVMAVGKSGEAADRDRLGIWIGGVRVAYLGAIDPAYKEQQLTDHMKGREIDIVVDVGVGPGKAQVWTCDLTHGYISINADYRS